MYYYQKRYRMARYSCRLRFKKKGIYTLLEVYFEHGKEIGEF